MRMRVLVTGGAGFIGSHAAKALARAGFEPVVFDNLSTGHRWAVRWGPLVVGDLTSPARVEAALKEHAVEAVIHFAAHAYVGESMADPRKYYRTNVAGSLNLLDAMLDAGIKQIVFSSTSASYGVPEVVPIPEDHPQRPINPYGETKVAVEHALRWYGEAYGLSWTALRYFNAAGADPEGEIGADHDPETRLIPLVIKAALGQRSYVEIYGTDYPTPDGTAVRDYVHVSDLADAHVRALEYLLDGGESAALNLGTGRGYSVREVVRMVEKVGGRPVPVRETGRRPGDPPVLVADPAKAGRVLGWRPRYADLETIVATAWRWYAARTGEGG